MSIYCTFGSIDDERERPRSRQKPIHYNGSHVLPLNTDEHRGSVDLAYIPAHITQGRRKRPEDGKFWPWLRLDVAAENMSAGECVILTREQVQKLRNSLDWWLNHSA